MNDALLICGFLLLVLLLVCQSESSSLAFRSIEVSDEKIEGRRRRGEKTESAAVTKRATMNNHKKVESEAEKICKRCRQTYLPSSNHSSSCQFHPSFFVCRRHDDQKRYYELRPDDPPYAAKFYDCCGAEDPAAPGCKRSSHVSYDGD